MNDYHFETLAVHEGLSGIDNHHPATVPIYQTASFGYEDAQTMENVFSGKEYGHVYSRISNPTVTALEQRITALENGIGSVAVSSGLSVIAGIIFALTEPGDHVIFSKSLFGGTYYLANELFTQFKVKVIYCDFTNVTEVKASINEHTRCLFTESIGNPQLDVPEIQTLSRLAEDCNIPLIVDSTLTSPYLCPAKKLGAHLVVHSMTKFLAGAGTTIGGLIIDTGNFNWKLSRTKWIKALAKQYGPFAFLTQFRKHMVVNAGSCLSPQNAFYGLLGLETLGLRMERHCENAAILAGYLDTLSKIENVSYPGLKAHKSFKVASEQFNNKYGSLLTFRCGSKERAFEIMKQFSLVKNMTNLGDSKTLAIHPASTIYRNCNEKEKEQAGVYDDLIRISVGLEHHVDIINDFKRVIEKMSKLEAR